jgi:hypothetical protein
METASVTVLSANVEQVVSIPEQIIKIVELVVIVAEQINHATTANVFAMLLSTCAQIHASISSLITRTVETVV